MLGLGQNANFRKSPSIDTWFVSGYWRRTKNEIFLQLGKRRLEKKGTQVYCNTILKMG